MPLSQPAPRRLLHKRDIEVRGYEREDGLWDIEGHMTDRKDYPFQAHERYMEAGEPVHDMWLRLTVDNDMTIVDAEASMAAVPFHGTCERIEPDYKKLVGLRIAAGFKKAVIERLGGLKGCTHLSELLGPIGTTAYQTMSYYRRQVFDPEKRPFSIDGCHTWDATGEVVRKHYPKWYRGQDGQSGEKDGQ